MTDPTDRTVVIAGASGGLGPSVARAFANAGWKLVLADNSADRLASLVGEFPGARGDVVDLLDEKETRHWAQGIAEVDCVAHLVGGWRGGTTLRDADPADWVLLHDLLIRTVQHTTRAFHDALVASPRGSFVLVSSKQGQQPTHDNAAYAAAKAAAEAWTLALADSFRAQEANATANVVVVNAITTPQMRADNPDKSYRTFTDAEEIADSIVYLTSPAARKMNGHRLHLHG
ncbi:MAG TPA: SDR family NAD(P)-dependent oxidoreductase [Solirubrobacteraceae bacterium]